MFKITFCFLWPGAIIYHVSVFWGGTFFQKSGVFPRRRKDAAAVRRAASSCHTGACSVAVSYKPPMLVTRVRLPACAFVQLSVFLVGLCKRRLREHLLGKQRKMWWARTRLDIWHSFGKECFFCWSQWQLLRKSLHVRVHFPTIVGRRKRCPRHP